MITQIIAILFNVYMLLWITSFVDSGLLTEEAEGKALYQTIIVIATLIVAAFTPVFGLMADKIPGICLIPLTFAVRCAAGCLFL